MLDQFGCQRNFLNLKNKTLLNSKNSSDSQIRLGVGIFFMQLFPNWTACSPITLC